MNEIIKDIYVKRKDLPVVIDYVQESNAIPIVFRFVDWIFPTGSVATIYVKKPSGKEVYNDLGIDFGENTVTVIPTTQMVAEDGKNECQLQIIKEGKILNTFPMILNVAPKLISDEAIESTDEYGALQLAFSQADYLLNSASNLQEDIDALEARMDTFTSLKAGSTSGDAELADIRVGYNGEHYGSAGAAVREQVQKIHNELDLVSDSVEKNLQDIEELKKNDTGGGGATAEQIKQIETNRQNIENLSQEIVESAKCFDSDAETPDLDISDENGNVLARFQNGHIKTKNFDSSDIQGGEKVIYDSDSDSDSDLDISDDDGNVLMRLSNGHIITKNFNSVNSGIKDATDLIDDFEYTNTATVRTINYDFNPGDTVVLHLSQNNSTQSIYNTKIRYTYIDANGAEKSMLSECGYNYGKYTFSEKATAIKAYVGSGALWGESGTLRFVIYVCGDFERKPHEIHVASDGSGDYTSLRQALESITDNNAYNKYNVYVHHGEYAVIDEYTDTEKSASDFVGLWVRDGISLIGIGCREEIIISGDIDTTQYDATKRNNISTLNLAGSVRLENLTVKAKNMRYAVHDDTGSMTERINTREIINCVFDVEEMTTNNISYGAGTSNMKMQYFKDCDFVSECTIHSSNNNQHSPRVVMENCKGNVFSSGDYNSTLPFFITMYNCHFNLVLITQDYSPHDQFVRLKMINCDDCIVEAPSDYVLFDSGCMDFITEIDKGKAVAFAFSASKPFKAVETQNATEAIGVSLGYIDGHTYVKTKGYVSEALIGLSELNIGDYVGYVNGVATRVDSIENSFGVVVSENVRTGNAIIKIH